MADPFLLLAHSYLLHRALDLAMESGQLKPVKWSYHSGEHKNSRLGTIKDFEMTLFAVPFLLPLHSMPNPNALLSTKWLLRRVGGQDKTRQEKHW